MITLVEFKNIKIDNISVTGDWDLTPFQELRSTALSNNSVLITPNLHPPIVKVLNHSTGTFELICGLNRLRSFQKSNPEQTHITVLVLPVDIADVDIFQYLIQDKLVSANFSDMEKAFFLRLCCKNISMENVAKNFLPLLGEKPQSYVIKKLLTLLSLEPELQESLHTGKIPTKLGYELLALSSNDRVTLYDLFKQLEFGGGKQKRFLSLCKDLAFRNHTDISTLLENEDYLAILNHSEMNIPQKGASLLNLLQRHLFPESTETENNFRKRVLRMELPANCTVEHSPAFERDEISVTMQFKDMAHLEKHVNTIKEILS